MELYLAKRPYIKEGTKKAHIKRYNDLLKYLQCFNNNLDGIFPYMLLQNKYIGLIMKYINSKNLPSRCCVVSTILIIISPQKNRPELKFQNTYDFWKETYFKIDNEYRGNKNKQLKTDKQKNKWVKWETILKLRKKLKTHFTKNKINLKLKNKYRNGDPLLNPEDLDNLIDKYFFEYQKYLILCLHTHLPPVRLEYGEMIVCNWTYYRKLSVDEKNNNIYLINVKRNTKVIIFGKLARKIKMKDNLIVDVPKKLCVVINCFIDMRNILLWHLKPQPKDDDTMPLLFKWQKLNSELEKTILEPLMSRNAYSKNFIKFMKKKLNKKVGVSLMRSIYTSYYRGGEVPLEEKKRICKMMNHSLATQESVYLKQD